MLLETATIAALEYNRQHDITTTVVFEPGNGYQWYTPQDIDATSHIVEIFPNSGRCPDCEEGKTCREVSIRYSGNWLPFEKYEPCKICDGLGTIH